MKIQHIQILNVSLNFGETDVAVGRLATKNGRIYFEQAGVSKQSSAMINERLLK